eukprot:Gb_35384 [translate_table: standard]
MGMYHVPRSWLHETNNTLVLFEETGGNPMGISVDLRVLETICAQVSESHPRPLHVWSDAKSITEGSSYEAVAPEVHLQCDHDQEIFSITFASFGNPEGHCGKFTQGICHAATSASVVTQTCQGKNRCLIPVSLKSFGEDPCPGTLKSLAIQAICMPMSIVEGDAQTD